MMGQTVLKAEDNLALTFDEKVDRAMAEALKLEQVECPVTHRFAKGIYIREVRLPAGAIVIGHYQNFEHANNFIQGKVAMLHEDGTVEELKAPMFYVAKAGRKIGYIYEDVIWQNIYPTDETDVEKLEEKYLTKNEVWKAHHATIVNMKKLDVIADNEDFFKIIKELGFTPEEVRKTSENPELYVEIPVGSYNVAVMKSNIEGKGLFATSPFKKGDIIAPARIDGKKTFAGRFINHAKKPNAEMILRSNGNVDCIALSDIAGYKGGEIGEEITVDYRQTILHIFPEYKEALCLE